MDSDGISRAPSYSGSFLEVLWFRLQDFHLLWFTFPSNSTTIKLCNSTEVLQPLHKVGLGYSQFARRYYGNRFFFLFLQVLRCFSSLGVAPNKLGDLMVGFPHSEIYGSKLNYS